jgi:uncharacterized protein YfaS (alpha-2-macroglobulin family)
VHDLYGRIINAAGAVPGTVTEGGGPAAMERQLSDLPKLGSRIVSVFSGIVAVDKSGKATVPLAIPDFDGKLRVMAVAWSAGRLGHAEASVTVRHPLIADLSLPRFLAPDDHAGLALALDNADGPRGEYRITVKAEGAVSIQGGAEIVANLAEHEQRTGSVALLAAGPGAGAITLYVQGPGGIAFERHFPLSVRAGNPVVARRWLSTIKPGGTLAPDAALLNGLRPDTALLSLAVGSIPQFDLAGIARELADENYDCAEQTVSTAALHLVPADRAEALGLAPSGKSGVEALNLAAGRLLGFQARNGGFGLWAPDRTDLWLSAYALDFLGRAKQAGAAVPDQPFQRGLDYLAHNAEPKPEQGPDAPNPPGYQQSSLEAAAYANLVLARSGRLDLFHLRYFADRFESRMGSPLAVGWTAAAFGTLGDAEAARATFDRALALPSPAVATDGFGSDLRDQAALTALMAESGVVPPPILMQAGEKTADLARSRQQFSPQEGAWIFRAAIALGGGTPMKLDVGGKPVSQSGTLALSATAADAAGRLPAIKNLDDRPLYAAFTATGASTGIDPKETAGFEIQRWLFDRMGKPADPAGAKQNDLRVVVLTGRFLGAGDPRPLIVDMLPAGWEIESADLVDAADRFPWLKDLQGADHAEARDDRYFAVPRLAGDRREFKLAYVVRAVTQGQFFLPGPFVEDMVRPYLFGRSGSGRTKVDPP